MNEDLLKSCQDEIKGAKTIITSFEKQKELGHIPPNDHFLEGQYNYLHELQSKEKRLKRQKSEKGTVNLTHAAGTLISQVQAELERSRQEAEEKGLNKPYWEKE
jgi:hypothetical protein